MCYKRLVAPTVIGMKQARGKVRYKGHFFQEIKGAGEDLQKVNSIISSFKKE